MVISTNQQLYELDNNRNSELRKITIYEKNHSERENHLNISTHKTLCLYSSTHLIIEERSKFIFFQIVPRK